MRRPILIVALLFAGAAVKAFEPRSLPKPLPSHPGNVFLAGENVVVPLPPNVSLTPTWRLTDFDGRILATVTNSGAETVLGTLPVGYYELNQTDGGPAEPPLRTIAVLAPLRASTPRSSPIGVDVAKAWAYPTAHQEAIASLCALAGISWVRDRLAWRDLERSKGEFAESAEYDEATRKFTSAGLQLLRVYHDSPTWANPNPKRMPLDLRDAYNFARTIAGRCAGQVSAFEPWNEADIEAFGGHTGAEMASYQKAAYLGLKAGAPEVIACQNDFASPHPNVLADFDANRAWPYFDTFNLHHYFAVEELPGIYAAFRTVSAGKPLWVTEFNHAVQWSGDPVWQEPTREDLRRQAERVPRLFAAALYEGPAVLFYFLLPHYAGGQTQFGLLHRDLMPRLAYLSLAAVGRLLADAKPMGKLGPGPGLLLFAFQARPDGEERDVLVGWSMNEEQVLQLPSAPIAVYDYIGRPNTNASKSLCLSRAPVFAVFERHALERVPWMPPPAQPPPRLGSPSSVVLQAVMPKEKVIAELSAYRCSSVESNAIPIFAYNFGKEKVMGHLVVTPPAGWRVSIPPELELAPGDREELSLSVDCSSGTLAPAESIRISGDFGPAGEVVLSFRLAPEPFKLHAEAQPIPRWAEPDAWKPNVAKGGEVKISRSGSNGLTVTAKFGAGERWVYPEHTLAEDQRPRPGCAALAVTLTSSESEADFRAIFEEENGSLYFAGFFPQPKPGETVEAIALLSSAAFGEGWSPPDDNHQLDVDKIRRIKIGCNPVGPRVSFTLKNLRWLKPPR